jgi:hypothetical protein
MNMPQNTMRYMARVSIEFTSPFLSRQTSGIEADELLSSMQTACLQFRLIHSGSHSGFL